MCKGVVVTDKELDEFIDEAQRRAVDDAWWIQSFCEDAEIVGKELKEFRENKLDALRLLEKITHDRLL